MKRKRLITCLLLAVSCLWLLAGCGGTNQTSAQSNGKVKITFGFYGNAAEIKVYKNLVNLYEKTHPNVDIVEEYNDPASFIAKLPTLMRSNSTPDVVNVAESWIGNLNATFKPFADLTPYLKKDGIKESQFIKGSWTPGKLNGQMLALPNVVYGDAIAYNKTLFNKYNIPLPKAGWTTQDLLNDAKKLTMGSGKNKIWGISQPLGYMNTAQLFGGQLFNYKTNKMEATNPKVVNAVSFQNDLIKKYKVTPNSVVTTNKIDPFLTGHSALDLGWASYDQDSWNSQIGNKFQWGIAPYPQGWHGVLQLNATAISNTSKNKQADWNFVKWICTNPKALAVQGQLSSPAYLPALNKWESNPPSNWKNVNRKVAVESFSKASFNYDGQIYTQIWNDFQTALESIYNGENVKSVLSKFQSTEQQKIGNQ